jgi:hypothetical protein
MIDLANAQADERTRKDAARITIGMLKQDLLSGIEAKEGMVRRRWGKRVHFDIGKRSYPRDQAVEMETRLQCLEGMRLLVEEVFRNA